MDYRIEQRDAELKVSLSGRLTFNDHGKVRAMIQEMVQSSASRQILEISGLEFVDSSGLGMILATLVFSGRGPGGSVIVPQTDLAVIWTVSVPMRSGIIAR